MGSQVQYLDVIQHANPCTEDWEGMEGDAWARHCPKCAQNVYNLSAMTAGEAERLLVKHEGRVCTKLYRRTDGSVLTQRCPSSVRKVWGRALRLAAAVGFAAPAFGHDGCPRGSISVAKRNRQLGAALLSGRVVDATNVAIPGAELELTSPDHQSIKVWSDSTGNFSFDNVAPGDYQLTAWAEGFVTVRRETLVIGDGKLTEVVAELEVGSVGGGVPIRRRPPMPIRATGRFFRWIGSAF